MAHKTHSLVGVRDATSLNFFANGWSDLLSQSKLTSKTSSIGFTHHKKGELRLEPSQDIVNLSDVAGYETLTVNVYFSEWLVIHRFPTLNHDCWLVKDAVT
jgi:hypothetical protein